MGLSPYDAMHILVTVSWPRLLWSLGWASAASCHENPALETHILREICQFRMPCWSIFKRLKHYYHTEPLVASIALILAKYNAYETITNGTYTRKKSNCND